MQRKQLSHSLRASVFWGVPLLIGGLWLLLASDFGEYIIPATAVAAFAGIAWERIDTHARRRQTALDTYAEREISRMAHSIRRRAKRRRASVHIVN